MYLHGIEWKSRLLSRISRSLRHEMCPQSSVISTSGLKSDCTRIYTPTNILKRRACDWLLLPTTLPFRLYFHLSPATSPEFGQRNAIGPSMLSARAQTLSRLQIRIRFVRPNLEVIEKRNLCLCLCNSVTYRYSIGSLSDGGPKMVVTPRSRQLSAAIEDESSNTELGLST